MTADTLPRGNARLTVYPGTALLTALAARRTRTDDPTAPDKNERSRSALVTMFADRYACMVEWAMPTFTVAEWCLIFDALNGAWMREPASQLAFLWAEVTDHIRLNDAATKWGCSPDLGARVEALPRVAMIALADAAERFWCHPEAGTSRETIAAIVGAAHISNDTP